MRWLVLLFIGLLIPGIAEAQQSTTALPDLSIAIGGNELAGNGSVAASLKIVSSPHGAFIRTSYDSDNDLLHSHSRGSRYDENCTWYCIVTAKYGNYRPCSLFDIRNYGADFSKKLRSGN